MFEGNIFKFVIEKDYEKAKYLLSDFLKRLYNLLKDRDVLGVTDQFTITTDALFYLMSSEANDGSKYITWIDYSSLLHKSLSEPSSTFPLFLITTIDKLFQFQQSCPIIVEHSNETQLLKIIKRLLKVCNFSNSDSDRKYGGGGKEQNEIIIENSNSADLEAERNIGNNDKALVRALLPLGPLMVKYGILATSLTEEIILNQNFPILVNQFINLVDTNITSSQEVFLYIGNPDPSTIFTFQKAVEYLKNFVTVLHVDNLEMLKTFIVQVFSHFNNITNFPSLLEEISLLIKQNDDFQQYKSIYSEDVCKFGIIVKQDFIKYKVVYVKPRTGNVHETVLEALHSYARCYIMGLLEGFYSNDSEYNFYKDNEQAFTSKLQKFISNDFSQTADLQSFIEFKQSIDLLVIGGEEEEANKFEMEQDESSTLVENSFTVLQSLISISGEASVLVIRSELNILMSTCNEKFSIIVRGIVSFSANHGVENQYFLDLLQTVEKVINLISSDQFVTINKCYSLLENLIAECGEGVRTIEDVSKAINKIKTLYKNRLPTEEFALQQLDYTLESFIELNNTQSYEYIEGGTVGDKLKYVHDNLTNPLREVHSNLSYADIVLFLNEINPLSNDHLQKLSEKIKNYDILLEEKNQLSDDLQICNEEIQDIKSSVQNRNETLIDENSKLKKEKNYLTKSLKKKEELEKEKQSEINSLREKLTQAEANSKRIENESLFASKRHEESELKIKQLQTDIEDYRQRNETLQKEQTQSLDKLQEENSLKINQLLKEVSDLKFLEDKKAIETKNLIEEKEALSSAFKTLKENNSSEIQLLKSENENLASELNALKMSYKELQETVAVKPKRIAIVSASKRQKLDPKTGVKRKPVEELTFSSDEDKS